MEQQRQNAASAAPRRKGTAVNNNTPTQTYIDSLSSYPLPSATELRDMCTALHAALIDAPEMLWMTPDFESLADSITVAMECLEAEPELDALDRRYA